MKQTTYPSAILSLLLALLSPSLWAESPAVLWEEQQAARQARVMLEVEEETLLSSQIDGRIQKIDVKDGDRLKRGQTLVVMDCAMQRVRKKKAEAELNAATQALKAQRQLLKLRSGSLMKSNLAAANVAKAKADLEMIHVTLKMCTIKAPFSGLVVKRLAHARQYVSKGEAILEVIDDSTLYAHLIVPSIWLLWLQPESSFTFRLDETGNNYTATVSHLGVRVDPASQTVLLKGRIAGSHPELKVGMGGMALFSEPQAKGR